MKRSINLSRHIQALQSLRSTLGRVWLVPPRTGFTRTARLVGTAPVLLAPASKPEQTEQFHFFTVKPGGNIDFWSQMITCIHFWVGFVVPYKVTMVTHTHFEECTKFGTFFTKMCSVSGVPFGWHDAAPCAPAVRSCSRSYQPNTPFNTVHSEKDEG